jgi:hypothetical protein
MRTTLAILATLIAATTLASACRTTAPAAAPQASAVKADQPASGTYSSKEVPLPLLVPILY